MLCGFAFVRVLLCEPVLVHLHTIRLHTLFLPTGLPHTTTQVIVMGIPSVERAVIQKDDKSGKYGLLVEGTGLQVRSPEYFNQNTIMSFVTGL